MHFLYKNSSYKNYICTLGEVHILRFISTFYGLKNSHLIKCSACEDIFHSTN